MQIRILIALAVSCASLAADDRASITGKVVDATGKPVDHATVLVYHAGVKQGYSTFCPSCYADCGKRTFTDAKGEFQFGELSPDLWFDLLVLRDGSVPALLQKVDPAKGTVPTASLKSRQDVAGLSVLRGHVVDTHGRPLRDVIVEPQGLASTRNGEPMSIYGTIDGLDPFAVTNEKGDFQVTSTMPATKMVIQVEPRGMAPKIFTNLTTGEERHTLTVTDGALIRGRLVEDGKPVPAAEVGVIARERGWGADLKLIGAPYSEIRVGTRDDGSFAITNVPPGVDWYLYGKMESLASRGATDIMKLATKDDGQEIDLGDVPVHSAFHLRGRVVLSDGKPVAPGTRVILSSTQAWDSQTAALDGDGRFEFRGLTASDYEISAGVRGYKLPAKPQVKREDFADNDAYVKAMSAQYASARGVTVFSVNRDLDDFTITLDAVPPRQ
jgi:protocatechuate 3,4-dioxygenase beta subunit